MKKVVQMPKKIKIQNVKENEQVGIPTKARAGFSLKGWFLKGRPLQGQGFGKRFQTRSDRSEHD